jgi:hypothetical protein
MFISHSVDRSVSTDDRVVTCYSYRRFGLVNRPGGSGEVYTVGRIREASSVVIGTALGPNFSVLIFVVDSGPSIQTFMQGS